MDKKTKYLLIRKIVIAIIFIIAIVFVSIKYSPEINHVIKNRQIFKEFILSYGHIGGIISIAFQFIQIVMPFLPGEVVQISLGYVYGTFWGSIYLIIGTVLGTVAVFYASRIIGYPIVKVFVSQNKMEKFNFLANSNKIEITMFVLFLLPGIPKDILVYLAGLTPIKPMRFFVISIISRTPTIIASAYIGINFAEGDFKSIIIMVVVVVVFLAIGFIFRNRILNLINKDSSKTITNSDLEIENKPELDAKPETNKQLDSNSKFKP